ncbi:uncharacterized protein G2W53_036856 [Senna tora]|uniref:Uncharacterized protein n=1 Tax=Senna tora TaxID=362788 RepID=A0A834STD1_9FABA|nr:uncharacterized protein G2W53_036856 [Senna tora]
MRTTPIASELTPCNITEASRISTIVPSGTLLAIVASTWPLSFRSTQPIPHLLASNKHQPQRSSEELWICSKARLSSGKTEEDAPNFGMSRATFSH